MYIIHSQTAKGKYNQNSFIKCETESIKSCLCDYDDVNLVSVNITVTANNNTDIAFKIVHHSLNVRRSVCWWSKAYLHCNAYVQFDTSGRLWQLKRDEYPANNADLFIDNSKLFKYKADPVWKTTDGVNHTNSSVKTQKQLFIKVFEQLLKIIRNSIN